MKLYKFRSLGTAEDYERALEIVETGKFWCSNLWDLNDPMEGIFYGSGSTIPMVQLNRVFSEKTRLLICSFSGAWGFRKPVMWGHYANGFRGIAIEISTSVVDPRELVKVEYKKSLCELALTFDDPVAAARAIATSKLRCWNLENEYRFVSNSADNKQQIGAIKAVHFGDTIGDVANAQQLVEASSVWNDYLEHRQNLISECDRHDISVYKVRVVDGTVKSVPLVSD